MIPLTRVVSLASPFAVIVVGKNIVPFGFLVGENPGPGDIMNGDTGIPLSLVRSSMKQVPLPNGELTKVAEVGNPCEVSGNAPPTIACGEGGGSVGVFGREPGIPVGGARVNGEYTCPGARRYCSERPTAGVSSVGVMGVHPLVAQPLKNVGPPNIPGEIGIPDTCGKTNFVKLVASFALSWDIGGGGGCWSPVGGVALPLLMLSLFCVTELLRVASICAADAIVGTLAGYCQTDGERMPMWREKDDR